MVKKRIHLIYSIALSAALVITGICLCVACLGSYLSGEQPFSREAVAAAFRYIAVPVYLCIALVIGGLILDAVYPAQAQKKSGKKTAPSSVPAIKARTLLYLRLALLCVGIGIFVYGFFAGGTADVMTKAVNICTECVGLG